MQIIPAMPLFFSSLLWGISFCLHAASANTLPLYPQATLQEWEPEFRVAVTENYKRLFQPKLSNAEAQKLRNLRIAFPLDQQSVLLEFYSLSGDSVVLPVASLMLLKDLATAYAWLDSNGYSTQPVLDYLAIIRQGRLSDWPVAERLPLRSLGIPANVGQDPRVMEKRNELLDKTILFILGHELGHVLQGFSAQADCKQKRASQGCDFRALQNSESAADAFAVEMFRRMGLVPSASNLFFVFNSRLSRLPSEFKQESDWREYARQQHHPLDSTRIERVASDLNSQKNAFIRAFSSPENGAARLNASIQDLRTVASLVEDRNLSAQQIAWAKSLLPVDIKPRRSDEPRLRPSGHDLAAKQNFSGYFTGELQASNGNRIPLQVILRMQGNGRALTGEVMLGGIRGRIEGQYADLRHVDATWIVAGDLYQLKLDANARFDQFSATYVSRSEPAASGRWQLARQRQIKE